MEVEVGDFEDIRLDLEARDQKGMLNMEGKAWLAFARKIHELDERLSNGGPPNDQDTE